MKTWKPTVSVSILMLLIALMLAPAAAFAATGDEENKDGKVTVNAEDANPLSESPFEINFKGHAYNGALDQTTYSYEVKVKDDFKGEVPPLNYWVLNVCPDIELASADKPHEYVDSPSKVFGTKGIKFTDPMKDGQTLTQTFAVKGKGDPVKTVASLKSTNEVYMTEIMGPPCAADPLKIEVDAGVTNQAVLMSEGKLVHNTDRLKAYKLADGRILLHFTMKEYADIDGEWNFEMGDRVGAFKGKGDAFILIGAFNDGVWDFNAQFTPVEGNQITVISPTRIDLQVKDAAVDADVKDNDDDEDDDDNGVSAPPASGGNANVDVDVDVNGGNGNGNGGIKPTVVAGAEIIGKVDGLTIYLLANGDIRIIGWLPDEYVEVDGTLTFTLGGKTYQVETKDDGSFDYTVADAAPGTYAVAGVFTTDDGDDVALSPVSVTVPTVTGGTLPDTSTPWYNVMAAGALLAAGGAFALLRRKLGHGNLG